MRQKFNDDPSQDGEKKKRYRYLLIILGLLFIFAGLLLLLCPVFYIMMLIASVLILAGMYLQSEFKRYDPLSGIPQWIDTKIQNIFPVTMNFGSDLSGKKILSTLLNLAGIAVFAAGLYIVLIPNFSFQTAIGVIFLMPGIWLLVKFAPRTQN